MARHQTKIRSLSEYACVAAAAGVLSLLPFSLGRRVMFVLADAWRLLNGKHRRLATAQCMARLGIGAEEARRLVKRNYRHYALVFLEVVKLRAMPLPEVGRRTDFNGCDAVLRDTLAKGRGMVVLTGHLGNWEWGCTVMGMLGAASGAIARPLDNPYIDGYVNEVRERTGVKVWNKFNCMRRALLTLKDGGGFVAVVDQDGGRRGCMVPFLGERGSTMTAPVDLAIRCGAPVYVGAVMRRGDAGNFVLESGRVHWPRPDAEPEAERLRLLTEINADLSAIIRKYPEQWIWIHRRWKTTRVHGANAPAAETSETDLQEDGPHLLARAF